MQELALSLRILVGLVFLTAAVGKVRHRLAFQGVVANYRLLPAALVPVFALVLPPVEVAVGGALLFAPPPWPELLGAGLLLLFAAAMAINIRRGRRHIDCGCFQSALKQQLNWALVTRNVALALLLALPALVAEGARDGTEALEAAAVGGVLFLLLQSMNILWSVVPAWRLPRTGTPGAEK